MHVSAEKTNHSGTVH